MANNSIENQVQELQEPLDSSTTTDSDHISNFSSNSIINDVIDQSLASLANQPPSRLSFRTLARLVLVLNGAFKKASSVRVNADLDYWRSLAQSRGEMNSRYCQVIEMQRKRIQTLEKDLRTLVDLSHETREILIKIALGKQVSQEDRGDGEYPY